MECPKCNAKLETISSHGIDVERCSGCYGLWFDMLEKEDLKAIAGSEAIDIGDSDVGRKYNNNKKIKCPECHVAMVSMIDKDQLHIQYEYCSSCHGTFFDAGEFRDLKEHTIIERFKQKLETIRSNIG